MIPFSILNDEPFCTTKVITEMKYHIPQTHTHHHQHTQLLSVTKANYLIRCVSFDVIYFTLNIYTIICCYGVILEPSIDPQAECNAPHPPIPTPAPE